MSATLADVAITKAARVGAIRSLKPLIIDAPSGCAVVKKAQAEASIQQAHPELLEAARQGITHAEPQTTSYLNHHG
ncbi:hypothetical protein JCM18909_2732 [Cutibacterium acnes JCM 18909]|nr:hypothetical protein JCM18909_2732 [Cutibacterium acnes JCM 18909]